VRSGVCGMGVCSMYAPPHDCLPCAVTGLTVRFCWRHVVIHVAVLHVHAGRDGVHGRVRQRTHDRHRRCGLCVWAAMRLGLRLV
jgi:hypothetical protein